jgi:hypothetical protein
MVHAHPYQGGGLLGSHLLVEMGDSKGAAPKGSGIFTNSISKTNSAS